MQRDTEAGGDPQSLGYFPMTTGEAQSVQRLCATTNNLSTTLLLSLGAGETLALQLIPAGEFLMGSGPGTDERSERESPLHRVQISAPFYMGKFPVTQAQWEAVMGSNPAHFQGAGTLPMETVSWEACVAFCEALSQKSGQQVRLPSESEWEYACRAGGETIFSFGDNWEVLPDHAWYRDNAGGRSRPVGLKPGNAWGLHDMHGGIDEYCQDIWHPTYDGAPADGRAWTEGGEREYRVLRGGSWYDEGRFCRSPHRNYYQYQTPTEDHGLRVVVEVSG